MSRFAQTTALNQKSPASYAWDFIFLNQIILYPAFPLYIHLKKPLLKNIQYPKIHHGLPNTIIVTNFRTLILVIPVK